MEPQDKSLYLSTDEAARLIGCTKTMFVLLADEFASDWLRPVYFGRKKVKMWLRQDVVCLAHIHSRRLSTPPERPGRRQEN